MVIVFEFEQLEVRHCRVVSSYLTFNVLDESVKFDFRDCFVEFITNSYPLMGSIY